MKLISLAIAMLMLTCLSCREDDEVVVDPELQVIFDQFEMDGLDLGVDIDLSSHNISAVIEEDLSNPDLAGKCDKFRNGHRRILIDRQIWNSSDPWQKEFLVYHELGHCVLDRDHRDDKDETGHCLSIMHSGPNACIFNYNSVTKDAYLRELFN